VSPHSWSVRFCFYRDSNPGPSSPWPSPYADYVTKAPDKERVRRIVKYLAVSGLTRVVRGFFFLRKFSALNPVRLARFGFLREHLPVCECPL